MVCNKRDEREEAEMRHKGRMAGGQRDEFRRRYPHGGEVHLAAKADGSASTHLHSLAIIQRFLKL